MKVIKDHGEVIEYEPDPRTGGRFCINCGEATAVVFDKIWRGWYCRECAIDLSLLPGQRGSKQIVATVPSFIR